MRWRRRSRASPEPTGLFFYDSISPIVDAESIDTSIAFRASRYGKSIDGTDDYLNCPFDKPQYEAFLDALLAAEQRTRAHRSRSTHVTSRRACRLKKSRAAAAIRCASAR